MDIASGNCNVLLLFNEHCIQYVIGCILGPNSIAGMKKSDSV